MQSRPARGAWVEIEIIFMGLDEETSRPARGAWVEIYNELSYGAEQLGRAPQGARGLKSFERNNGQRNV